MSIILPDYGYDPLVASRACGLIRGEITNELEVEACLDARCSSFGAPIWVRLMMNFQEDPDGLHLHVDGRRESSYDEIPSANSSIEDLFGKILDYSGQSIQVTSRTRFEIPADEMPDDSAVSLLLNVSTRGGEDQLGMHLTGATFSLDKGPIEEISWCRVTRNDRKYISAEILAYIDTDVSSTYLRDCAMPAREMFQALISAS